MFWHDGSARNRNPSCIALVRFAYSGSLAAAVLMSAIVIMGLVVLSMLPMSVITAAAIAKISESLFADAGSFADSEIIACNSGVGFLDSASGARCHLPGLY